MKKRRILLGIWLVVAVFLAVAGWYISRRSLPIFQPAGPVGHKELNLILFTLSLAAIVVIPTYAIAVIIAMRYREENHTKAKKRIKYDPDFDHSRLFEAIWWGIPIIIIGVLSVVTWNSTHTLDPYKPLASDKKPLTIQVVALDWKWLFIYPKQHVASVNLAEIPVGVPVDFHVTSDTIMNSFWVPALGGQIYAMPGMDTQLHEQADKAGSFMGSPANIAGHGFSRMDFTIKATSQDGFNAWVKQARHAPKQLDAAAYTALAKPSESVPVTYYADVKHDLYNDIVMKYMTPQSGTDQ